jgi:hypothetical protein
MTAVAEVGRATRDFVGTSRRMLRNYLESKSVVVGL